MKGYSSLYNNKKIDIGKYYKLAQSVGGNDSQPYSATYHVDGKMQNLDKKLNVYKSNGYEINPTAKKLIDKVNGDYIGDRRTNMIVPYAIDAKGNVIIGKRNGNGRGAGALPTPHPTLIGGKDPVVIVAGMLDIRNGKIYSYNNMSGHYKPNKKSLKDVEKIFAKFPNHKRR